MFDAILAFIGDIAQFLLSSGEDFFAAISGFFADMLTNFQSFFYDRG